MAENFPLDVSTWIRMLGPDFKDSIAPYDLSCVFPYHQIRVDEPFPLQWSRIVPIIEEFGAIIGDLEIENLVFPTIGGDPPPLCCKLC